MNRGIWIALGAGLWLTTAGMASPVLAVQAPVVAPDYAALDRQEAADAAIVDKVAEAVRGQGLRAMSRYEGELAGVLDRAPATYAQIELRPGLAIVRSDDPDEAMKLTLTASALAAKAGGAGGVTTTVRRSNSYIYAALLLGSWAVERRRPDEAIAYLDRGLALQPNQYYLTAEKAAALVLKRQFDDVPEMCDAALEANPFMGELFRAKLLRAKGFALIELDLLDLLDAAEAAYVESQKFEPDSPAAAHELDYIRQLRRGRPRTEPQVAPLVPSPRPSQPDKPPSDRET